MGFTVEIMIRFCNCVLDFILFRLKVHIKISLTLNILSVCLLLFNPQKVKQHD